MNAEPSKWEIFDNEEEQVVYDVSPLLHKNETNSEKQKSVLKEDIDLYCPALPSHLTKNDYDHSSESKENAAEVELFPTSESVYEYSELDTNVNEEPGLSEDIIYIKSEKFQEDSEKTVIDLDSPHNPHQDGFCSEAQKDFHYDQIAVITDDRYVPYIKHLRRPGVIILSDENLQVVELEKYLPHELDKSCNKTLFLLVIGVHSITEQVSANYCKVAGCNRPLQALNSFTDVDKYCEKFVRKLHAMLISVKKCLPTQSNIAILPPLPIALHSNHKNHQILHSKQSQFPRYMIDNMGDAIAKWYPIWIDRISDISRRTLAACDFKNMSILDKLEDNDYKNVKIMACKKGFDKPCYNVWMKVLEDLIDNILKNLISKNKGKSISKNFEINDFPNQNKAEPNKVNDLSLLLTENTTGIAVAYDHLVFIGYAVSLKLLPHILFSSYSQWHLDDSVAVTNSFSLQISALNSRAFKKVLFIIISDISMIGTEEKNSECLLKHCEESITYFKAPNTNNPVLLIKNINRSIASLQKTISEMEKYCNFRSKFIIAPFTPRIYVPISSIIFHRNMHDHLQKQICTRFLRGCTKQIWDDIVKKFEAEWCRFMLEMLNENDIDNINIKNILSVYMQNNKGSITWKDLFSDSLDSEFSILSLWQSCLISLAVKGSKKFIDDTIVKTEQGAQMPSELFLHIEKSLTPKAIIDDANCSKKSDEFNHKNNHPSENDDIALEESEKECDIDKANIYRDIADVLSFSKNVLNMIKDEKSSSSSVQSVKFKSVFIIGQIDVISPLLDCNIKSSLISHKLVSFEESDVNNLLSKIGKFKEKSLCCLVFDISIITKECISSWCVKNSCQQPIFGTVLKIDNSDPMKELDQLISNQLKKILKFTRNLSKHIPTIILPLSPTRMYLEDEDSPCHLISHKLLDMGCPIIYGSYSLWDIAIRSLVLSWNNLMELTNKNVDSLNYVTSYIESKPNIFIIIDNINDFITQWTEHDLWKAVVETFLLSLVPLGKVHSAKIFSSHQPDIGKYCVTVSQVPSTLPIEFFKQLFLLADQNVFITEGKDSFTLEKITLSRALVLTKKLNDLRIGDSFLNAYLNGSTDEDDLELSLMQKLFISSSIDNIYNKWKPEIINNLSTKIDEVPNIFTIKSSACEKGDSCRGPKVCFYYHSSNDRRRNPFVHQYSDVLCTKPKIYDECHDGDQCNFSHNDYEAKFHPSKYQIKDCPSGALADICNSQDLCKFAHEDSPEMFYTAKWEDLIVIGLQHSLRYFTGAICAASKIKDDKRCKLKICLMSCSLEFIDILVKVSRNLIKTFGMKVCDVENNISDSDSCQILVGNPSSFVCLNASLFSDTFGVLIIDDAQKVLQNDVHKGSLQQFLQMIAKGSTNGVISKVFVCNTFDNKFTKEISAIVGFKLKLVSFPEMDKSNVDLYSTLGRPSQSDKRSECSEDNGYGGKKIYEESDNSMSSSSSNNRSWRRSKSHSKTYHRKSRSRSQGKRFDNKDVSRINTRSSRSISQLRKMRRKSRSTSQNMHKSSRSSKGSERKRRSRSHSSSRLRRNKRKSRSHSRTLPKKSRSCSRDKRSNSRTSNVGKLLNDYSYSNKKVISDLQRTDSVKKEKELSIQIVEQFKIDYPPIMENHMTVCSTTLWVGHLPKSIGLDELSYQFGVYGEIEALDLVSVRGCAYICMSRRQDATKAMKEVNFKRMMASSVIAWAPGRGMKGKTFKDYWDVNMGCSYIPYEILYSMGDLDFDELEKGGIIDGRTVPLSLKGYYEGRLHSVRKVQAPNYQPIHPSIPVERRDLFTSAASSSRQFRQCPSPPSLSSKELYHHNSKDIKNRIEDVDVRKKDSRHKSNEDIPIERDIPSNKNNHLTVCSTTLWVGSLSKFASSRDLESGFGAFGKVLSVDIYSPSACAYVCLGSRRDAEAALAKKNLKIKGKNVILAWAPGKGLQEKKFSDFWNRELGCSFIPYDKLVSMNINVDALEDGGWIDQETLPPARSTFKALKHRDSSSISLKGSNIQSQNFESYAKTHSHGNRRSKSRSSERVTSKLISVDINKRSRSRSRSSDRRYCDLQPEYENWKYSSKKKSRSSFPISSNAHESSKQPFNLGHYEKLVTHPPSFDAPVDLRIRFGQKLFDEYNLALDKLSNVFEKDFNVYYNVPELYPNYNKYYESFASMYVVQHRGKNAQHKERLWKLFWKSVFEDIKIEEWEISKNKLVAEFDGRALNHSSVMQPSLEQSGSSYSGKRKDSLHVGMEDFQSNISQHSQSFLTMQDSYYSLKGRERFHEYEDSNKWNRSQQIGRENISSCSTSNSFCYDNRSDLPTHISRNMSTLTPSKEEAYYSLIEQDASRKFKTTEELRESSSLPFLKQVDASQEDASSYSFEGTISLIEKLSSDLGFLGPSVKVLMESCKDLDTSTKAAHKKFTESENLILIGMVSEKLKSLRQTATGSSLHLYDRAMNWIPRFLDEAKEGAAIRIEDLKIDLEAIGRASLGKEPKYVLDLIKMAISYEGIDDPPKEVINELFLKVCSVHFTLAME